MYTIKAITSLTGLTPETLRAWERRYGTVSPQRDDNGRRFYCQNDLEKLSLLAQLTRQGHSIGKLCRLDQQQLKEILNQPTNGAIGSHSLLCEQILDALMQYRLDQCEQLLKRALIASEPLVYVRDTLIPTLQQVGQRWHEGTLSIAQEHMFSACVKRIVFSMVNNIYTPTHRRAGILLTTPSGEPHEFGVLMACLIAAVHQYNCYYLGPDLPAEEIVVAAQHLQPNVIVLSLTKTPPEQALIDQLQELAVSTVTTGIPLWIGGKGAEYLHARKMLNKRFDWISDITDFHNKILYLQNKIHPF